MRITTKVNWVDLLDKAEFTYNNSEHASTKMTPLYANSEYHPPDSSAPVEPLPNPLARSHLETLSDIRAQLIETSQRRKQIIPSSMTGRSNHTSILMTSHFTL
jgi:hypothetical protein